MRLRYAALSDVGRVRRDNQDSGYAGPYLLVIADGVGGSARGDIASAATVEEIRRLDEPPPEGPAEEMLGLLAGAIHKSHDRIARLVRENPEIEGTSSTLTAAIFDGIHVGIGHVGDSRGYLLRDGALSQLTTDHTFVQSLIDEGRITEDEARVHPHRNLILRAVDGVHEPEPDVFVLEAAPGDRLLLCSDGCSGALAPDALGRLLGEGTPQQASQTLVAASLDAGSTDNVTVVVADIVADDDPSLADLPTSPVVVGSAAAPTQQRPAAGRAQASDTGELAAVSDADGLDPEEERYAPRAPRRFAWARRAVVLVIALLVLALIAFGAYRWSQSQYFVNARGEQVVIYQGVDVDVPGIRTHHVVEASLLTMSELSSYSAGQVRDGNLTYGSLTAARAGVKNLVDEVCGDLKASQTPSATPSATPSPTATRTASPRATRKPGATPSRTATPTPTPTPSPTPTPAACQDES